MMQPPRDPLDRWLEEIPPPSPPPWFAAKTMARIRQQVSPPAPGTFRWRWLFAVPATAALVLAGLLILSPVGGPPASLPARSQSAPNQVTTVAVDLETAWQDFITYVEEQDQWPVELAGSPSFW